MILKEINLRAENSESAATEIMFEVAGARADGIELLRINITDSTGKILSGVVKLLKEMKRKGLIQFYASAKSFSDNTTEANYLINKYSDVIGTQNGGEDFLYIKI